MLNRDALHAYCQSKPGATRESPFGPNDTTYKVGGKIFAQIPTQEPLRVTVKCDPSLVPLLRSTYPAVQTAPYTNKNHWNNVLIDGSIPDDEVLEMIDNSYALVVRGLSKAQREALKP